jgi:RimJ/RimL family protein N-acetyltransferase
MIPSMSELPVHRNHLGQVIGPSLPQWTARPHPPRTAMRGRLCQLELLDAALHARALHEAYGEDESGRNWTYLPYGPFPSADAYADWVSARQIGDDPLFYAIVLADSGRPVGVASYLRIEPAMGSIEVGHLSYSPALQRSAVATEAMYLMMRRAFDELGYRRYEWKCDSLNGPVAARGGAARLPLRGHVPADDGGQAAQPRQRMVFDPRLRVARAARCVRAMARPGQLRRERPTASSARGFAHMTVALRR